MSINTNLAAISVARTLKSNYSRLEESTRRLSTGLRVNSADDDAAGLAIRELMRSDISALRQGMRNANDGISMLQVADGALGIIDEKLIRMKELAEQAATGTYDSTQRMMIDSEFQAMGEEIDRIARATDFNGIKLLDGSLSGTHDGSGIASRGMLKIHFGTLNDSAEDYYYVDIDDCTTAGLGLRERLPFPDAPSSVSWINEAKIDYVGRHIILDIQDGIAGEGTSAFMQGLDFYQLPVGLENITITSNGSKARPFHKPHVSLFLSSGQQLTGVRNSATVTTNRWDAIIDSAGNTKSESIYAWWNNHSGTDVIEEGKKQGVFDQNARYIKFVDLEKTQNTPGFSTTFGGFKLTSVTGINEIGSNVANYQGTMTDEIYELDTITSDLVFFIGGHDNPTGGCNRYRLRIEADITDEFLKKLKGWAGDGELGEPGDIIHIDTQEKAQNALVTVNEAIVKKDKVRAHIGALQNRLENTVTNVTSQCENLQAAESRISDADIAREMTDFVRCQILSQSSVAMLGQANSFPRMMMTLIGA